MEKWCRRDRRSRISTKEFQWVIESHGHPGRKCFGFVRGAAIGDRISCSRTRCEAENQLIVRGSAAAGSAGRGGAGEQGLHAQPVETPGRRFALIRPEGRPGWRDRGGEDAGNRGVVRRRKGARSCGRVCRSVGWISFQHAAGCSLRGFLRGNAYTSIKRFGKDLQIGLKNP